MSGLESEWQIFGTQDVVGHNETTIRLIKLIANINHKNRFVVKSN